MYTLKITQMYVNKAYMEHTGYIEGITLLMTL